MQLSLLNEHPHATIDGIDGIIAVIDHKTASRLVVAEHYLHRRPPISYAFGLYVGGRLQGVVTYGTPPSRHLQMSACPDDPSRVVELNRLWLHDSLPRNSESWFVSRTLKMLPPTDMERKTPRYDYVPHDPRQHTREAFRSGYAYRRRRVAKVKYWTVTGDRAERRALERMCGWPSYDWRALPPPVPELVEDERTA